MCLGLLNSDTSTEYSILRTPVRMEVQSTEYSMLMLISKVQYGVHGCDLYHLLAHITPYYAGSPAWGLAELGRVPYHLALQTGLNLR